MTRFEKAANLFVVVVPFIAFIAAVVLLWNRLVDTSDLVIFFIMYCAAGLGVTIGFHRLLTHRAFQTHKRLRYFWAILGQMAVQGPVIDWVADHRKHHAHTDQPGDPHSPHVDREDGWKGALRGLYHAHMGWLLVNNGQAARSQFARDLTEDPGMRKINRNFHWIVLAGLAIPFTMGFAIDGNLAGALTALFWGGPVRMFLQHHVTWSINSVCHFFGRRRFEVEDHSTNVFWLALPSFGESWHHNHHAFPRSAEHGLRWWELDVSAMIIKAMQKVGLAWNVTIITPERQQQKLAAPPAREKAAV